MEKIDDIEGSGNALDFGARVYDSRLGRWFKSDPQSKFYPNISPYVYAINSCIKFSDKDGEVVVDENGNVIYTIDKANTFIVYSKEKQPDGSYKTYGYFGSAGRILGDDGTEIKVLKITDKTLYELVSTPSGQEAVEVPADYDCTYNCTGNALTNKDFVIGSDDITSEFKDEEGLKPVFILSGSGAGDFITNSNVNISAKENNIGMYHDQNGVVQHLEIFVNNSTVLTKGGVLKESGPIKAGTQNTFTVGNKVNTNGDGIKETTIVNYTIYEKTHPNTQVKLSDYSQKKGKTKNKSVQVSNEAFEKIKNDVKTGNNK